MTRYKNSSEFSQSADNKVIRLYNGVAPGSENCDWSEVEVKSGYSPFIYNVTTPTLTVFEADKSIATGSAVIVCPGGSFYFLSIDNEGYQMAKWLNSKGITAFVLKYRLVHLINENIGKEIVEKKIGSEQSIKEVQPFIEMGIEDGKTAMVYVREHASEWSLRTDQIGIMGFSAGGTIAIGVSLANNTQCRPNFTAWIYPFIGNLVELTVPVNAPPMFMTVASDDNITLSTQCTTLYNKWVEARRSAEIHIYRTGNHGFGLKKQNIPTDKWADRFYEWLTDLYILHYDNPLYS
jgi:acetyl esterase/lipase